MLWVCTDWTVFPSIVAMQSKGLKVTFDFAKASGSPQTTVIKASYYNTSPTPYTDFIFQAAVPKVSEKFNLEAAGPYPFALVTSIYYFALSDLGSFVVLRGHKSPCMCFRLPEDVEFDDLGSLFH